MITLSDEYLIGKDSERICFINPENENECIKIYWQKKRKRNESYNELKYSKRKLKDINFISKASEWTLTDKGIGLIYDLVRNYDGSISYTLDYALDNDIVDENIINIKLKELKVKLLQHNIAVTDLVPKNICCKFIDEYNFELIIIDGYGYSNLIPIGYFSNKLQRKQTEKRFNRVLGQLMK